MDPASEAERVAAQLRRVVEGMGFDLRELSRRRLHRAPEYLSEVLRGARPLGMEDLFEILLAIDVPPAEFFAELYDLYPAEGLGAELAPGIREGPLRRFVEKVSRRAADGAAEGQESDLFSELAEEPAAPDDRGEGDELD